MIGYIKKILRALWDSLLNMMGLVVEIRKEEKERREKFYHNKGQYPFSINSIKKSFRRTERRR